MSDTQLLFLPISNYVNQAHYRTCKFVTLMLQTLPYTHSPLENTTHLWYTESEPFTQEFTIAYIYFHDKQIKPENNVVIL